MSVRRVFSSFSMTLALVSSADAAPPDRGSQIQAATELVEVMHLESNVNDAIDIMLKLQLQTNPDLRPFEDIVRAYLSKYMSWDALRDDYTQLYADTFSEAEIKELVSFYRTPAGQKLINSQPQILRRGVEIAQARVGGHLEELKAEVRKRIEESQKPKEKS